MRSELLPVVVGAVAALLLQIVLAPNIAVFSAMPNFLVVYVLVVAMVRPGTSLYVLAFVLGLLSDLLGYGPVGATPFLLILASAVVSRAFAVLNNDTVFVPLALFMAADFVVEFLYSAFLIGLGFADSAVDALIYRALPCALYSTVVGLVAYPLARHFMGSETITDVHTATPRFR